MLSFFMLSFDMLSSGFIIIAFFFFFIILALAFIARWVFMEFGDDMEFEGAMVSCLAMPSVAAEAIETLPMRAAQHAATNNFCIFDSCLE